MKIRSGQLQDAAQIADLLNQLDYAATPSFTEDKLKRLLHHPDARILVAIDDSDKILGFVSLHFIPQLGVAGDFCRISYFCVDRQSRSAGIGKQLEAVVVEAANQRQCDRIEVHCHSSRSRAHSFYMRQGYIEDPKYLLKRLNT